MDKTAVLASDILLGVGGEQKYSAPGKLYDPRQGGSSG